MSARTYNGQRLTPAEVAQLNRREAALLVGGIGTLALTNLHFALRGRTVVCVLIRRAFHLDHPDPKVRRRGWVAFDAVLLGGAVLFRHHIKYPWRQR